MIGNSKHLPSIQRHFSKMYAGLHTLKQEDDSLTQMISKEGETVPLLKPIPIQGNVNEWLEKVDKQMVATL